MDNKNNLVSTQLITKYPRCISDILAQRRNSNPIFTYADVCICCHKMVMGGDRKNYRLFLCEKIKEGGIMDFDYFYNREEER